MHENAYMQNVYNLHHQFEPEVLVEIEADVDRQQQEQQLLDLHFGQPGCVNVNRSARGVMQGRKHSEETKVKFRARKVSEETRHRLSESLKGHFVSEATRQKCSVALTGKKRPDTAARNKAEAGWKHTPEAREKISEAGRSRMHQPHTKEAREKISLSLRGKKQSPETIQKRVESNRKSREARKQGATP